MTRAVCLVAASILISACHAIGDPGPVGQTGSAQVRLEHYRQTPVTGAAPGTITLDLLAGTDPIVYWQYTVTPWNGQVTQLSEVRFRAERIPENFDQPAGAIYGCGLRFRPTTGSSLDADSSGISARVRSGRSLWTSSA